MTTLKVFYAPEYLYNGVTLDTTNKAHDVVASLAIAPISGIELVRPSGPVTAEEIGTAHSGAYTEAIIKGNPRELANRNGLCTWTKRFSESRLWSTGGVRDAVLTAYYERVNTGSMSSGLHHARKGNGAGFCTLNGLVIGAKMALEAGAKRVLILDLDAHGGGGTASLIDGIAGVEQVDIAVSAYDGYASTTNSKYTLTNGTQYLDVVVGELAAITDPEHIDVMIYNAGVDPHEHCSTGGVRGITTNTLKTRDELVFLWAAKHGIPVAFVFAGGYVGPRLNTDQLAELHRNTMLAARDGGEVIVSASETKCKDEAVPNFLSVRNHTKGQ